VAERTARNPPPKPRPADSDASAAPALAAAADTPTAQAGAYTVVARRYRPQDFTQVVGQDHVVRALSNAIRMNRIAQAYLFSGTRGVGKTSIARIFAKCLNCVQGPTATPCQVCDICQAISQGQDVDVIEIDGASNNGVEQVRELRQNASLRPSRCRFKIYYIDEVHMLSTNAFNALLKTLEEPPAHVKFFFATTEPNKIPITVLSRCQRFDFAGITPEVITKTLGEICEREGVEAETDALQVVARRATGSLRDAQSLLDRLLSSGAPKLTVEAVHALLGTASDERLLGILEAMSSRDAATALQLLDKASSDGVQPVELLDGIIDYLRDAMVLAVQADSALMAITPRQKPQLLAIIAGWSLDAILAALQILDETRRRLRGSPFGRLLVEMSFVKVARLEDLATIETLLQRLAELDGSGAAPRRADGAASKKKLTAADPALHDPRIASPLRAAPTAHADSQHAGGPPASQPISAAPQSLRADPGEPSLTPKPRAPTSSPPDHPRAGAAARGDHTRDDHERPPLDLDSIRKHWPELLMKLSPSLRWRVTQVEPVSLIGSEILVIAAKPGYSEFDDECSTPEAIESIRHGLQKVLHRQVSVHYERSKATPVEDKSPKDQARHRTDVLMSDPLVNKVIELFEARPHQLDYDEAGHAEDD
jgi:DNA polymerase-3 subunit gamma/tau